MLCCSSGWEKTGHPAAILLQQLAAIIVGEDWALAEAAAARAADLTGQAAQRGRRGVEAGIAGGRVGRVHAHARTL